MCIICLKPAGVEMPSDEDIKYMFDKNSDGAGFAIQGDIHHNGEFVVEFQKGFMNVDDLLEALGPKDKLKNLTVAIHCRIKTSGKTDKATTHPFLMSNQYSDMKKLEGSGAVLFHNGVISGLGGIIDKDSSDTQDYVAGVAMRYLNNARMPGKIAQKIVDKLTDPSRILILYPKRKFPCLRIGTWYQHNGCWYSNTGYRTEYSAPKTLYDYDDYYRSAPPANKYTDIDEYGANVAEYAWPKTGETWVRTYSKERWSLWMAAAKDVHEEDGEIKCRFLASPDEEWYIDELNMQLYTKKSRNEALLREAEEFYCDSLGYDSENDEYIMFNDEEELYEWQDFALKLSDYKYRFDGKEWYVDEETLEAYTDKGLKMIFPTNEIGHARKQLEKYGTIYEHEKEITAEKEQDGDSLSTTGNGVDEEISEEISTEDRG